MHDNELCMIYHVTFLYVDYIYSSSDNSSTEDELIILNLLGKYLVLHYIKIIKLNLININY